MWLGLLVILSFLNSSATAAGLRVVRHPAESGDTPRALVRPALRALSTPPAAPAPTAGSPEMQVTLSAAHATTSWDARDPHQQRFDLPLLYLHREREATAGVDRTLEIHMTGLPAAAEIQIQAISRRLDVSTGMRHRETRVYRLPNRPCAAAHPCTIQWTFDAPTTPSDLYTLRVLDPEGRTLWKNPHRDRPDFALLDTWDVQVGSAKNRPYTVRVYYGTLFPFAKGQRDFDNRLPPDAVTDFIEREFAPIIQETWRTQLEVWGFGAPLHPDWDLDQRVEIFITDPPFALFGGTGTYSRFNSAAGRPYPERRIWWFSSNNAFHAYDSLQNGYKVLFAHEFFHLAQWNVLLLSGNPTHYAVNLFIEAQGKFAPSVQYPALELSKDHLVSGDSRYGSAANRFPALRLNSSYADLETEPAHKYDAALYWRFLYEQYGDMEIIRIALEEMAYHLTADIVTAFGDVMDSAFARVDGPFRTFEESLVAFSRAVYALRLENGRCGAEDTARCGGLFYDPQRMYGDPALEAWLDYTGESLTHHSFAPPGSGMAYANFAVVGGDGVDRTYQGSIPASFGTDLIEVELEAAADGRPLKVAFQGRGAVARFRVQVWRLGTGEMRPHAVTPIPDVVSQNREGTVVYFIPRVERTQVDRLALIITRLDADETKDPLGRYNITLDSR
jgi:hypothetical protein